nr:immunoglobulin light chain junction region [Macaca mulatta]MOW36552.1 immunoglobulin light chain junction region [Macaca mulatta]MOW37957.1 immunoglobulin light chain junction region [Macaca mulatta]MOW38152.1 immunoglobulin light chain junction region [Macaca mulatta]MOW38996.1 immunoglobulin light chain junction region [Macaca mulatta]
DYYCLSYDRHLSGDFF